MILYKNYGLGAWKRKLELTHDSTMRDKTFSDSRIRIFVVPVPKFLRPDKLPFVYPKYSHDWGVEQDFDFAVRHSSERVFDPIEATHHYLPIYWTRYWVQNKYGKEGIEELRSELKQLDFDEQKLFTVCQYDDGPLVDLHFGNGLFLSSRKTEMGQDIPLIASPFPKMLAIRNTKNTLLSFQGRVSTHTLRVRMMEDLGSLPGVVIRDQITSTRAYYKSLTSSYVALAPRGYGGSSFRFFEAMQVATVPALIGDLDTRPFKEFINWGEISFYAESAIDLYAQVTKYSNNELLEMGKNAQKIFWEHLAFGKWTKLLWQHLLFTEINRN